MLRAVRLAAKLDFSIDPASAEPLPRLSTLLSGAAPARLFDECLKLFLSGHAEKSFLGLERHGLLPALFPETAKALATNRSGALRATVLQALRNTDARVAAEQPVTPAFLFAALLWPAYCRELAVLQKNGVDAASAQQRAADRVTLHQAERIALPRRFSLPMQEIWLLQPRFTQRVRKRVFRLLAHPRFRAAFDFLELRVHGNPEIAADVQFWREAQSDPEHAAELLEAERAHAENPESDSPKPRRRRRRRGSGGSATRGGAPSDAQAAGATEGGSKRPPAPSSASAAMSVMSRTRSPRRCGRWTRCRRPPSARSRACTARRPGAIPTSRLSPTRSSSCRRA
jgi:poly(A) polymerase